MRLKILAVTIFLSFMFIQILGLVSIQHMHHEGIQSCPFAVIDTENCNGEPSAATTTQHHLGVYKQLGQFTITPGFSLFLTVLFIFFTAFLAIIKIAKLPLFNVYQIYFKLLFIQRNFIYLLLVPFGKRAPNVRYGYIVQ